MSHKAMLKTIKTELDNADASTLQSVWESLRQAKQSSAELPVAVGGQISRCSSTSTTSEKPLVFIGENPPFEPNQNLSLEERIAAKRLLKANNREWLLQKFKELRDGWLMVVDAQVIASGATLSDYPEPEQILEVCHRTGKFPFLFINEDLLAIEESGTTWHPTTATDDLYPTVKIKFRTHTGSADIVADSDTVASAVFVDYDFLIKIACVAAWRKSPFIKINPNRTALVGRTVFLKLKPRILLDFDRQESKIWAPLQPHKKEKSQLTSS